jgi:predicted transcriptional regulator
MAQTSILIQLDESVQARLAALAQLRQMPVSDVAADVITTFLSPESWESQRIQAGMLELEEGKGIPNERVMDWLDSWGSANELPAPK